MEAPDLYDVTVVTETNNEGSAAVFVDGAQRMTLYDPPHKDEPFADEYYVTMEAIWLRSSPEEGLNKLLVLPHEKTLELIEEVTGYNDSKWAKVVTEDGLEGYVMLDYIKKVD